jgi:hypothetical protein
MNEELEEEFSKTTNLLLGSRLKHLNDYGEWIGGRVPLPKSGRSALSGKEVWVAPNHIYMGKDFNLKNVISLDEMDQANESSHTPDELDNATVKEIMTRLVSPIRYHCGNFRYLSHENVWECSGVGDGRNLFRCDDVYLKVKNVAYSNYTIYCENAFGCHGVDHSSFVIHAYNCTKVSRCFEVDSCSNCSGLLFCHNCENVHDSMFCFNAKNLRYAIGNVELGPEKFKEIKSLILNQIVDELEKTKSLKYDIFNIGCRGEKLWHHKLMKH